MLTWLANKLGFVPAATRDRPAAAKSRREIELEVKARYDAAQTTPENRRHWAQADSLGAKSANDLATRTTLRKRARYEIANGSWATGVVNRWSTFLVGTGPRLQVVTKNRAANAAFEKVWREWEKAVSFSAKLRTMAKAKIGDGEGILLFRHNPRVSHPVKFDVQGIETDQVSTPQGVVTAVDGVDLDEAGNVSGYYVLDEHPGDAISPRQTASRIDKRHLAMWFRQDRAGQVRGIPEVTPALELFARLRRYSDAVLSAAELVALHAITIETDMPPDDRELLFPFDQNMFDRAMVMAMPAGWKQKQIDPKQPVDTYDVYERCLLRQASSALDIPLGLAIGDFSAYNYSSARLEMQTFGVSLKVQRGECVRVACDPAFEEWYAEARLIPNLLPPEITEAYLSASDIPHLWYWDGLPYGDPVKEAQANAIKLSNNMTTHAKIYATDGDDWEPNFRQRGVEVALETELGIKTTLPGAEPVTGPKSPGDAATTDESEEVGDE